MEQANLVAKSGKLEWIIMPRKKVIEREDIERPGRPGVAIVTGGAGEGIGRGITDALTDENWAVLIVDKDADRSMKIKEELSAQNKSIEVLAADITSPESAQHAVQTALERFGRIDGLVNSAGVGLCKSIGETTDQEFDHLFDVDFRAAFRFSRAVIRAMLSNGGGIVNIGSIHARRSFRGYGLYGSVKAALEGFTRGIAIDYGSHGIRANCVHPGMVMCPQTYQAIRSFSSNPDSWIDSYMSTKQLLNSPVTARQIGNLVAWLLSANSETVTGQSFIIDGGSSVMLHENEEHS